MAKLFSFETKLKTRQMPSLHKEDILSILFQYKLKLIKKKILCLIFYNEFSLNVLHDKTLSVLIYLTIALVWMFCLRKPSLFWYIKNELSLNVLLDKTLTVLIYLTWLTGIYVLSLDLETVLPLGRHVQLLVSARQTLLSYMA